MNELRSRAGVLMAAAALATSSFGGQAITEGHLEPAAWIAASALTLVGASVLTVLWPRHDWEFNASASEILREYADGEDFSLAAVHRSHSTGDLELKPMAGPTPPKPTPQPIKPSPMQGETTGK